MMDNILEDCGDKLVDSNDPRVVYTRLSNEVIPLVYKPLSRGPAIEVSYKDSIYVAALDIALERKTINQ